MSPFNKLPDELLQQILNYAMHSEDPFDIETYFQDAQANRYYEREREENNPEDNPYSKTEIEQSQKRHALDWILINTTSRRFRKLGKEAFFSNKIFAMEPDFAVSLQQSRVTQFTPEDQQTALKYIQSVVLFHGMHSPTGFVTLPRRLSLFPRLKRLDHLFGYHRGEPATYIARAYRERLSAPEHFTEVLAALGVPTKELNMGIVLAPGAGWGFYQSTLQSDVYPILRFMANNKRSKMVS